MVLPGPYARIARLNAALDGASFRPVPAQERGRTCAGGLPCAASRAGAVEYAWLPETLRLWDTPLPGRPAPQLQPEVLR